MHEGEDEVCACLDKDTDIDDVELILEEVVEKHLEILGATGEAEVNVDLDDVKLPKADTDGDLSFNVNLGGNLDVKSPEYDEQLNLRVPKADIDESEFNFGGLKLDADERVPEYDEYLRPPNVDVDDTAEGEFSFGSLDLSTGNSGDVDESLNGGLNLGTSFGFSGVDLDEDYDKPSADFDEDVNGLDTDFNIGG